MIQDQAVVSLVKRYYHMEMCIKDKQKQIPELKMVKK